MGFGRRRGKDKDDKPADEEPRERRRIEFNLEDGFTWHDVVGIFLLILLFIWRLIRLILTPIFWVINENVRMWRFIRAKGHDRVMTDDERYFVETIPFVYSLTGLVGGILLGVFAAFTFRDIIERFIESINVEIFNDFFGFIGSVILWIWNALVFIVEGIGSIFTFIYDVVLGAFQINPFLAFGGLILLGIVVVIIWVTIVETGIFEKLVYYLQRAFFWLIGSPDRFRLRVGNIYRRFNHRLTAFLVGKDRLHTRTHVYFKRSVTYTLILSAYSFAVGIYIGTDPAQYGGLEGWFSKILFTSTVLFIAGVVSGTLFFALMTRFFDLLNRKKYISPEFIQEDGTYDMDAMKSRTEEDEERFYGEIKEREDLARKMAEEKAEELAEKRRMRQEAQIVRKDEE